MDRITRFYGLVEVRSLEDLRDVLQFMPATGPLDETLSLLQVRDAEGNYEVRVHTSKDAPEPAQPQDEFAARPLAHETVSIRVPHSGTYRVTSLCGEQPSQVVARMHAGSEIIFDVRELPNLGHVDSPTTSVGDEE